MTPSDAIVRVGAALAELAAPYADDPTSAPCAALADLARLAGPARRVGAIGDRYRDAIGGIVAMVARGDLDLGAPSAIDVMLARLDAARRHFAETLPSMRRGAARNAWVDVPEPTRREIRLKWRGVPTGPIGNPDVATFGRAGFAPDQYRLLHAHDRAARAVDRALRAALHSARNPRRNRARVVTGYRDNRGTYHAHAGRKPRRK